MINYAMYGVNDPAVSHAFFKAVLGTLGYVEFAQHGDIIGYAPEGDYEKGHTVWVGPAYDGKEASPANGHMIGFTAKTRQQVRDFHAAALNNGGSCDGPPGIREVYGPNYYMAYVRDPVGNKMSAICVSEGE